jgi:hypothetical protein
MKGNLWRRRIEFQIGDGRREESVVAALMTGSLGSWGQIRAGSVVWGEDANERRRTYKVNWNLACIYEGAVTHTHIEGIR